MLARQPQCSFLLFFMKVCVLIGSRNINFQVIHLQPEFLVLALLAGFHFIYLLWRRMTVVAAAPRLEYYVSIIHSSCREDPPDALYEYMN